MTTLDNIKKERLAKKNTVELAGWSAYPVFSKRTHSIAQTLEDFSALSQSAKEIFLTGRLMSLREHGGLVFGNIHDGTGNIQILVRKDTVGEKALSFFISNFDIGDFVQLRGTTFITKKGEKTLQVQDFKMLTKSLVPLPEKWHGLKDVEERYRKRYLDLIFNGEVRAHFELRSKIIKMLRQFLDDKGFMEVETPVLQPLYGGASARPFKTHLNALDMDLYLRIAPELYLKRLLVGGFDKVYEIGRCFRNEGMDKTHNPDFTMLEFYWAYSDYKELMKCTEEMFSHLLKKLFSKSSISYQDKKIDFKTPWPRVEYNDLLKKYAAFDFYEVNLKEIQKKASQLGIKPVGGKAEIADEIYKKVCRPQIWDPTFVIHYPVEFMALAKATDDNPAAGASFQLVTAGFELVKAYSELNDPVEQRKRFMAQEKILKEGFEGAQRLDEDFLEALEYGMPPAGGWGMGIDRLAALLTNSHSLREIILFPTMRPR